MALTNTELEEYKKIIKAIKNWRQDIIGYLEFMFYDRINDKPLIIPDQQKEVLLSIQQPGSKVNVKSGHGVGKTTALALIVLWFVPLFPNAKALATAPSASQLKDILMAEIGKWLNRAHPWLRNQITLTTMGMSVKGKEKTQFLSARTARKEEPSALQGFHEDNMLVIADEAFGIADSIYEVAKGTLTSKSSRVILCGNPTAVSGYAYNTFNRNKDLWKSHTLSCLDAPAWLVDPQYAIDMEKEYGDHSDIYKVRVLGEFPSASIAQFIATPLVDEAIGKHLRKDQYHFAAKVLGVDVAYFGDDKSVIVLRQGLMSTVLGHWYDIDTTLMGDLVAQNADKYEVDAIFVDAVGVGVGVVDRLRYLGRQVIGVKFGARSAKAEYLNKRAECWGNMRDWLVSGGSLDDNNEFREELINVNYGYTPTNQIQLERKELMKKRGVTSPDLADALALTFAHEVLKNTSYGFEDFHRMKPAMAQTEYDVLNRRIY